MIDSRPICTYCHNHFTPSLFHPHQTTCTSPECQRRRKNDSHRKKIETDPDYKKTCIESRKKWCDNHPDYQRSYRLKHEAYVEQNRQMQQQRNHKRQLELIVKNNLAIDIKQLPARVWMTGPGLEAIVKNNIAISQIVIFQAVSESRGHI